MTIVLPIFLNHIQELVKISTAKNSSILTWQDSWLYCLQKKRYCS